MTMADCSLGSYLQFRVFGFGFRLSPLSITYPLYRPVSGRVEGQGRLEPLLSLSLSLSLSYPLVSKTVWAPLPAGSNRLRDHGPDRSIFSSSLLLSGLEFSHTTIYEP